MFTSENLELISKVELESLTINRREFLDKYSISNVIWLARCSYVSGQGKGKDGIREGLIKVE
jgi:hypothetical protein